MPAAVSLIVRYLSPYRLRHRMFVGDVSQIWNALLRPLGKLGMVAYLMQVGILQEYYRL